MVSKHHSHRQKTSKPLSAVLVLVLSLLVLIIFGYIFNWTWTGLHGRTLYDWLQLLIIPAVLAVGGYWFNYTTSRNEQAIVSDNQSETAMKEYFDKMSELMLHENLSKSDSDSEVRKIARVLTLTVLPRLDERRKRRVLDFLYESCLIDTNNCIIDMSKAYLLEANLINADLRRADMHGAILSRACLFGANLGEARLSGAILGKTDLSGASLRGANLVGADLIFADLRDADLTNADLTGTNLQGTNLYRAKINNNQLDKVKSLEGAIMPDGTQHAWTVSLRYLWHSSLKY